MRASAGCLTIESEHQTRQPQRLNKPLWRAWVGAEVIDRIQLTAWLLRDQLRRRSDFFGAYSSGPVGRAGS